PNFDYKQAIRLIGTTNVYQSLMKRIKDLSTESGDEMFFIFFNSVKEVNWIISQLKIQDKSILFCSKEASLKLHNSNFNVKDTVVDMEFKKYNFLTSRFFSAMDIKVDYNPHVILLSNLRASPHSKIDPQS